MNLFTDGTLRSITHDWQRVQESTLKLFGEPLTFTPPKDPSSTTVPVPYSEYAIVEPAEPNDIPLDKAEALLNSGTGRPMIFRLGPWSKVSEFHTTVYANATYRIESVSDGHLAGAESVKIAIAMRVLDA